MNTDLSEYLSWYGQVKSQGIVSALGAGITVYPPSYDYLLSLMTLLPFPAVVSIKFFPVLMDLINAFLVYKIVSLRSSSRFVPLLAAGLFLCLPTVWINSAFWGQWDAIYTGFLLLSFYFILRERPLYGILAFAMAFSFKAQAVFFAPFLGILWLKQRIPWKYFLLIPPVYMLSGVPAMLVGRNWLDVLSVYLQQGNEFHWLSGNAPNLYFFIPNDLYQTITIFGLFFAGVCAMLWTFFSAKRLSTLNLETMVLLAFLSVVLMPFILPKMHERYFYPADVFSLIAAFYLSRYRFLPVIYQWVSGLSYLPFLFGVPSILSVTIAAVLNTTTLIFLLRQLFRGIYSSQERVIPAGSIQSS